MQAAEQDLLLGSRFANMAQQYDRALAQAKADNYKTIGVHLGPLGFSYNFKLVAKKAIAAPRSWKDLIKPEYKDLSDQMAQGFGSEGQGIPEDLVKVVGGLFLQHDAWIAVLRRYEAPMVSTRCVGWKVAAVVGGHDFKIGKPVQPAFEDQLLQSDGGVRRIADGVGQPSVTFETLAQRWRALRMHIQRGTQLLGLGPEGVKAGIGKVSASTLPPMAAPLGPAW